MWNLLEGARAAAHHGRRTPGAGKMSAWTRTADGWAMNLDGTDGLLAFSLPRLELRSTRAGWRGLHFLADGRCREWACAAEDSLRAAKATAMEEVRRFADPPRDDRQPGRDSASSPAEKAGAP
jgi:hypothetical protein